MRFDPQAGFTPTDAPETGAAETAAPSAGGSNRGAKVFGWVVVGGAACFAVWQFALPIFAPGVINAISPVMEAETPPSASASWEANMMDAIESFTGKPSGDANGSVAMQGWDEEDGTFDTAVEEANAAWIEQERAMRDAFVRAERLMAMGKYDEATDLLREVIEHSPDDAQAHYKLGLAFVMQRDMASARAQLAKLRELNPSLASLLANLVPRS